MADDQNVLQCPLSVRRWQRRRLGGLLKNIEVAL
jgi:hypothetical protein